MHDHLDHVAIRDALRHNYAAHGLPPDGGAGRPYFFIRVGPLSIPAPNPGLRKRALLYHDMHHLVTGYDTVFTRGEMIIAGHEIGAGCGRFAFAWLVNLWVLAVGLFVRPRQMFAAFVRARRCDSLYRHAGDVQRFMDMTVGEMKQLLRLDQPPPHATPRDRVLFALWCAAAWLVTLACAAVAIAVGWGMVAGAAWLIGDS